MRRASITIIGLLHFQNRGRDFLRELFNTERKCEEKRKCGRIESVKEEIE